MASIPHGKIIILTMPIDWPEYKIDLREEIERQYSEKLARKAPLSQQFTQIPMHEGDRAQIRYPNGDTQDIIMKEHQATYRFSDAELESEGHNIVLDALESLTDQMAAQAERSILDEAANLPPDLGGMITATTPDGLAEQLLTITDRMVMDFDDEGRPTSNMMVLHPQNRPVLIEMINSTDFVDRFASILEKKRNEWRIREGNRRLAD